MAASPLNGKWKNGIAQKCEKWRGGGVGGEAGEFISFEPLSGTMSRKS